MDHGQFDELTRNVFGQLGARRTLIRFLVGSALVGMGPHARHLGPAELAAAVAGPPERTPVTPSVHVTTWTRAGRPEPRQVPFRQRSAGAGAA